MGVPPEGWDYGQVWAFKVLPEYDSTDYSSPAYDDTAWERANGAFGGPPTTHPVYNRVANTAIPKDSTVWFRARLRGRGAVNVPLDIDGNIAMWLDGVLLYQANAPGFSITVTIPEGGDLLAVRVDDDFSDPPGDWTWFDMPLPAEGKNVTRLYPRDDEYGLGAAPRLHPPPASSHRLYGNLP